jgi:group I intron endonuclease
MNSMNGKIYEITNLINGKRYIGQTVENNPTGRWDKHKSSARKNKKHPLYYSMRKYGIENFKFSVIIDKIQNQKELNRLERVWINQCHLTERDYGYNLDLGGNGVGKRSDQTKMKISISNKVALLGNQNHKGKLHSEETRKKMSKPHTITDEMKLYLSKIRSGKRVSIETEFKKGHIPTHGFKKGMIPWNKGIKRAA